MGGGKSRGNDVKAVLFEFALLAFKAAREEELANCLGHGATASIPCANEEDSGCRGLRDSLRIDGTLAQDFPGSAVELDHGIASVIRLGWVLQHGIDERVS
jgi:hypothetical protein